MKFGRKSKNASATGGSFGAAPGSGGRPAQRQGTIELGQNTGTDGLPGKAGYPNGPRTQLPTFFEMRRPDGKADQTPVKKRFFG